MDEKTTGDELWDVKLAEKPIPLIYKIDGFVEKYRNHHALISLDDSQRD